MEYFVISNDEQDGERWRATLGEHGYDVVGEYDSDAVIVTLGGDGTILYAARKYADPTILPVRTGDSKGYKTQLDADELLTALEVIETDQAYTVAERRKITAYRGGTELQSGFGALNEISLHHASPTLATVFAARIRDRGETFEFERVVGDGVVVATPFGSTGYYRSITGGQFTGGLGVAFNNVHTPVEAPSHVSISAEGAVELELLESEHASGAVLSRDNDAQTYELDFGEPVKIRQSDDSVGIVQPK